MSMLPLVALLACTPGRDRSLAPLAVSGPAIVDGPLLRDDAGRTIVLRGFNAGGRAKMPPYAPFEFEGEPLGEDFQAQGDAFFGGLAALGANTVRLTFAWEALEPTPGVWDDAYVAQYRALLDLCDAHGLRAIVDFHQDVYASAYCGDGFPHWTLGDVEVPEPRYDCGRNWSLPYFDPDSDVSRAFDRLWQNTDGTQDAMAAMWQRFASEIGDHPAVAGFEVVNEPGTGSADVRTWEREIWPPFVERMGAAIRAGSDATIFQGGSPGASGAVTEFVAPDLDRFVFAPHFYAVELFLELPEFDRASAAEDLAVQLAPADEWGVPVLLGEFGAANTAPPKADFVAFVLDRLDERLAHATVWDAHRGEMLWNGEDFSVFAPDGSERSWADAFARGYPRATSGTIERFVWDRHTSTLELVMVQEGEGVTEIVVPTRHVSRDPRIEVTGARWNWLPDEQLLVIVGDAGATVEVEVGP